MWFHQMTIKVMSQAVRNKQMNTDNFLSLPIDRILRRQNGKVNPITALFFMTIGAHLLSIDGFIYFISI